MTDYTARWNQFLDKWTEDLRERRKALYDERFARASRGQADLGMIVRGVPDLDNPALFYSESVINREETLLHYFGKRGQVRPEYLKKFESAVRDWLEYHEKMMARYGDQELANVTGDRAALERFYRAFPEM